MSGDAEPPREDCGPSLDESAEGAPAPAGGGDDSVGVSRPPRPGNLDASRVLIGDEARSDTGDLQRGDDPVVMFTERESWPSWRESLLLSTSCIAGSLAGPGDRMPPPPSASWGEKRATLPILAEPGASEGACRIQTIMHAGEEKLEFSLFHRNYCLHATYHSFPQGPPRITQCMGRSYQSLKGVGAARADYFAAILSLPAEPSAQPKVRMRPAGRRA